MNTQIKSRCLALLVACSGCAALVTATTYTFTGAVNTDWANSDNWSPDSDVPGANDDVIIPTGKHCRVESQNHAANSITIQGTGQLGIAGYKLTLGQAGSPTNSTVGGTLYFEKPASTTPELALLNVVTLLSATGTITAKEDDHDAGLISDGADPANSKLVTASGTTLLGSLTFLVDVTNNGAIRVDDADDTMVFGGSESPPTNALTGGSGSTLKVEGAGTIRINAMELDGSGTWTVTNNDGNLLWLTDKFTIPSPSTFETNVEVKRGTMQIDADFTTKGDLTFGTIAQTATIKVASGKAAEFNVD
ncbi:MAG: hypothetical protein CHACPFDD_02027 [Phycisphaerae bacterium]|nr:hypothetical protein [Phycisphaerae bacterium]